MQCRDIMRRPVQYAKLGETIAVAARKMRDFNIGFLAVCGSDGRVQGVLTDRDIAVRVCAEDRSPSHTRVDAIMSRELLSCRPNDELAAAEGLMAAQQKSRILVLADDGHPLGVISLSDIAAHMDPRATQTLRDVAQREVLGTRGKSTATQRP